MWVFLLLFFAVAFSYTVLNISIAESKRILFTGLGILVAANLIFYPFCLKITNQTLENLLAQPDLVSLVALIQVFESIIFIAISTLHIKGHFKRRAKAILHWLVAFPSVVFLIGTFFTQSYAYLHIEGVSFWMLGLVFSIGTGLFIYLSVLILKLILPEWDLRAELKMLTALFQILLAMFLPLIVKGVQVPFTNLVVENQSILITFGIIGSLALVGFIQYFWKNKKYYNKTKS